uniref:Cellular retinoic acid binding protein 1 n=3 Tax=Australaves TaxID=3073809 RepID=A0A8C4UJH7_FALTI
MARGIAVPSPPASAAFHRALGAHRGCGTSDSRAPVRGSPQAAGRRHGGRAGRDGWGRGRPAGRRRGGGGRLAAPAPGEGVGGGGCDPRCSRRRGPPRSHGARAAERAAAPRPRRRPAMPNFAGTWKMRSSENFDELLKALGVNAMLRKVAVAAASKPHVEIRQDGDQFYIKTSTTVRTTEINFKIGESFEEETVDGRKCRVGGERDGGMLGGRVFFRSDKRTCWRRPQGAAPQPPTPFPQQRSGGSGCSPRLVPRLVAPFSPVRGRAAVAERAGARVPVAGQSRGRGAERAGTRRAAVPARQLRAGGVSGAFCSPLPRSPPCGPSSAQPVPDGYAGNGGARETSRVRIWCTDLT